MKRTSFVCFGAQGSKDSLVYQEIPGREGGEEFFLFFSPGNAGQEELLRMLFREAVSASRLGAPAHYFARFLDQFRLCTEAVSDDEEVLANALLMIMIRRGDDVHLLCNRDASLVHRESGRDASGSAASLRGCAEVPMSGDRDQRDLFKRAPEDIFVLNHFTMSNGEHTLILLPSKEFLDRHGETLRNSVFFPSLELPRDRGIEIDVPRSFPMLRWKGGERAEIIAPNTDRAPRRVRMSVPFAAGVLAAAVGIFIFMGPLGRQRSSRGDGGSPVLLSAQKALGGDSVRTDASKKETSDASRERSFLSEAWKKEFRAPVTSSPNFLEGRVYFGCRDGFLYAFTSNGELLWKYRSEGGIGASPCCVAGRVVCADYRGDIFCLDANTGKAIWSLPTRSKIVSSPQAGEDLVVAGTIDGRLLAVRLKDGKMLWEKKLGRSIWANPAVGKGYIVAATKEGSLIRLDHRGKVIWKTALGAEVLSSPACLEEKNLIIVGARSGYVYAYSLSGGTRVWRFSAGAEINGSPLAGPNSIYIGTDKGDLCSLGFDGTLIWQRGIGGAVLSRPLLAGTTVFATTYASRLVALEAETGKLIGEYRAASPIYSSPEQGDERIYFGSNGGTFHALRL